MRLSSTLTLTLLAACGGGDTKAPDAAAPIDAGPPSVRTVVCPPGGAPTVTTTGPADSAMYMPMSVSVSRGGIVKFMMPIEHNVAPNTLRATDPGLTVNFGATACLEFDKVGTFNFMCTAHSFTGSVVVQ